MMKTIKNVLMYIFILFVFFVLVSFFISGDFEVKREITINDEKSIVMAYLSDFRTWPEWTVWNAEMDTTVEFGFDGAKTGKGAIMVWNGERIGDARFEITEKTGSSIKFYMSFLEDKLRIDSEFILEEIAPGTTKVIWKEKGNTGNNPAAKYIRLFLIDIDKMFGKDMERGLENLKGLIENKN